MTANDLIKKLLLSFNNDDKDSFIASAQEYIEREKRMKHTQIAKELERALFDHIRNGSTFSERRFRNIIPIPRDAEKGFPLLEIREYENPFHDLIINNDLKEQIDQIINEYRDSDILATYNLNYKKKILLCGKPGTGKTYTAQVISSYLNIPLIYVRFDSIISSYLGETATNLRKVFDYIEQGDWIVLFDEFDIIGKNRNDLHEHGEIKRVVNNFLQMLDNYNGSSIIFAATNHQHILDPAIWRRFDDVLYYDLPNENLRYQLLERYLRPLKRESNINIEKFVIKTKGLSPADLKMIAQEAMKISILKNKELITETELEAAINRFLKRERLHKSIKDMDNELL